MSKRHVSIGVDGGLSGAIAVIASDQIAVVSMPTIAGKGKQRSYDIGAICKLLSFWQSRGEVFVTAERTLSMPIRFGGGIANWWRGYSMGVWEGLLISMGIPYQFVTPVQWMREMHAGTKVGPTKQRSVVAATRLFPRVGCKTIGEAEALLIASYGRRAAVATSQFAKLVMQ